MLDQGSTHGSFVNGARIERSALKDGDVLQLGSLVGLKMHFRATAGTRESTDHMTIVSELLSSFNELPPAAELLGASGDGRNWKAELVC